MKYYAYRHWVRFEETNLVGNVYYTNHLRWQGHCRERFLRDHAPEIHEALRDGLVLATVHCSCDYLAELEAFDLIELRMRLNETSQNQIRMEFEYWRIDDEGEALVARGRQQIACMRRQGKATAPSPIPKALREALQPYR